MKGKRNVHSRKSPLRRGMMYGGFTVLLTCVIVIAYYLISNGVIFGKYIADEPYIAKKYIDDPGLAQSEAEANPDLTVTAKNSYKSLKKTAPLVQTDSGTKVIEYLGFQEREKDTGTSKLTGKRTILFDLENKLSIGDLYTSISIMAKKSGQRLKVYSAEFTKTRKEDSEKRVLTLFSANESIVTKDNEECRTDASWNADSSVSFTTENPDKNGGMRFYVDGVKKEAVDLKGFRYLKVVVESEEETEVVIRGYKALPEVPKTNGSTQKGTKENPFILVEIVPEMSQQAYSLLVSSQEEGLPFDPLEFSYEALRKGENIGFWDHGACRKDQIDNNLYAYYDTLIGEGWKPGDGANGDLFNNTNIKNFNGWFNNNNHGFEIYNPNGTVVGAAKTSGYGRNHRSKAPLFYLSTYYTVEMRKDKNFASELSNGMSKRSIGEIQSAYPEDFVDKDGKEIPFKYFKNDAQWKWTYEKDSEDTKEYTVKFEDDSDEVKTDYEKLTNGQMTVTQFAKAHRELFARTTKGDEVLDKEIERTDSWKHESKSEVIGYFVYVGDGKGDFSVGPYEAPNKKVQQWEDLSQNRWKYYEKLSDIPADMTYNEIWSEGKQGWEVQDAFNNLKVGDGFPAVLKEVTSIQNSDQKLKVSTVYTFKYKYEGYIFRFELIGVKFNDILKRSLFYFEDQKDSDGNVIKTADEQYEDTHVKVMTLTPSMINQMDQGDTPETLDIVERADMFYIATYDNNTDDLTALMDSYHNFSNPVRNKNQWNSYNGELASFHENDLEWVDCMTIIKRLSGDCSLPMLYSRQMGMLLDEGVKRTGDTDIHMYMDDKIPCSQRSGSLNNIAKLYLISTQFDLSADKDKPNNQVEYVQTFMDDVYDNIRQVPLTEDSNRDPDSAKYTGFYMRKLCQDVGHTDEKLKQKCYYLWNILTFLPEVATEPPEDSLYNGNHTGIISDNFVKYGFLKTSVESTVSAYLQGYYKDPTGTAMGGITGTVDPSNDYQNVVVIHKEGQPANGNFSIFAGGIADFLMDLTEQILSNGNVLTPSMGFSLHNNKETRKYYQRISNDCVLIDYSQSAEYKSDKTMYLFCSLNNSDNEETSILKSATLINENDSSKAPIKLKPENLEGNPFEMKLIDFDKKQNLFEKINGYPVPEKQTLNFRLPFLRSKWQEGYTKVRLEWVARSSKESGAKYTPTQNPLDPDNAEQVETSKQFAEITIGERGLFALQ